MARRDLSRKSRKPIDRGLWYPKEHPSNLAQPSSGDDLPPVCFLYVLKVEGHDFIKIGKTKNIERRLADYKTHMPFTFYLVDRACFFSEFEAEVAEKELLSGLKENRFADIDAKHGEWFSADLLAISNLMEKTFPKYAWENLVQKRASEITRRKAG